MQWSFSPTMLALSPHGPGEITIGIHNEVGLIKKLVRFSQIYSDLFRSSQTLPLLFKAVGEK
jgi:hypothetical protein